MALDKKDLQILYWLDQDCRQSLTQIAKKVRLHRNVVEYRIKNMESSGVIRGYYTQINTMALGYITFRIFFNISNATPEHENSLIEYLKSEHRTIWFFRVLGRWDYDVLLVAKDLFEIDEFLEKFQIKFNSIIEERNVAVFTQIYDLPKDYLIGKKQRDFGKQVFAPVEKNILDKNEMKILKALSNNARIKIVDLAKKSHVSINTVISLMKQLKDKKIISGYRPFIDTAKSGFQYHKIHINLRQYTASEYIKIRTWLGANTNIISINRLINGDDIEIEIHLMKDEELNEFMTDLKKEFGFMIKNSYIIQFTDEFIFSYLPEEILLDIG